jgi:hypothetical protein
MLSEDGRAKTTEFSAYNHLKNLPQARFFIA